ncbi:MAG: hypothetical protein JXA30_14945 [Deltaproteobacteria bacterium]|nr:hypothetical protein [Deltaproteobacteria bacterium]
MDSAISCKQCGLPAATSGIRVSQAGRCSYCEFVDEIPIDLFDTDKHRRLFEDRINAIRGKYEYDAIVGISGGKDGVYVLHRLVRDYGLRVLAATYDNEFLSDEVKAAVDRVIAIYNVDHYSYKPTHLRSLYRGILKAIGVPCYACAMAGYYIAINALLEKRIPLFVHGRSPFQMFRNLSAESYKKDPFFTLVKSNLQEFNPSYLIDVYQTGYSNIEQLMAFLPLDPGEKEGILDEFFRPLTRVDLDFVPEGFAFFLIEPYDENRIRDRLMKESGYIAPPSHQDCVIHNAANYLSASHFGVSVDVLEAAVMRRRGLMDRAVFEALLAQRQRESQDPTEEIKRELKLMLDKLDMKADDLAKR